MQVLIVNIMDARDILVANVDRLCHEKGWKHFYLARRMGVKPESLSRSLNGLPRIDTIEKIAKALDVSIKSLFEDPIAIEGFVSVGGQGSALQQREGVRTHCQWASPEDEFYPDLNRGG